MLSRSFTALFRGFGFEIFYCYFEVKVLKLNILEELKNLNFEKNLSPLLKKQKEKKQTIFQKLRIYLYM